MGRPGDEARKALTAVLVARRSGRPTAAVKAWFDEQDAANLNVCLYLTAELGIDPAILPKLVPLLDRERLELVFDFQNAEFLRRLEDDIEGES